MADGLRAWITALAGVIVFGSLCEMILPSGVYKKYVQLAVGIMLVIASIKPIVGRDFLDDNKTEALNSYRDMSEAESEQKENILKIHQSRLEEKMTAEIKSLVSADFVLSCDVADDEESFGAIKKVYIKAKICDDENFNADAAELIKLNYGLTDENIEIEYIYDK